MNKAQPAALLAAMILASGCASRGWVHKTTDPMQQQLDQVAEKQSKQAEELGKVNQGLQETKITAGQALDNAKVADSHALEAQSRADSAGQKASQNSHDIEALRQAVANVEDYAIGGESVVHFGFNQDTLTDQAKKELDAIAAKASGTKRFFFAIEGFTDRTGPAEYNHALSKRRAEQVALYLIAQHHIPVQRVFQVGLGDARPVEAEETPAARAKNRRVEIRFYTADKTAASASSVARPNNQ